jgi:Transglycosylase SLT domain
VNSWLDDGDGPKWLATLNAAEVQFGIPSNLLARMAFEESSFRPEVINGTVASKPGALGILQLMPQFFKTVNVSTPFTEDDTRAQIGESAKFLSNLFARFGDWQEAVAAYNWGAGNEHHECVTHGSYELADMPLQTQNYVTQVFSDVPIRGVLYSV